MMQILATICTCQILMHLIRDWPSKYKLILTIIFLFNPNIISTTQLIQSEIFTMLFLFPPLKTLPIPQNTKGMIIIPTNTPANLLFEKVLILLSINPKLFNLLIYKKQNL